MGGLEHVIPSSDGRGKRPRQVEDDGNDVRGKEKQACSVQLGRMDTADWHYSSLMIVNAGSTDADSVDTVLGYDEDEHIDAEQEGEMPTLDRQSLSQKEEARFASPVACDQPEVFYNHSLEAGKILSGHQFQHLKPFRKGEVFQEGGVNKIRFRRDDRADVVYQLDSPGIMHNMGRDNHPCEAACTWYSNTRWRPAMEDAHFFLPLDGKKFLFGVFDGHGVAKPEGAQDSPGKIVSSRACHYFQTYFQEEMSKDGMLPNLAIHNALLRTDQALKDNIPEAQESGTTAMVGLLDFESGEICLGNVGDSRAALVGLDGSVKRLTCDHSFDDDCMELKPQVRANIEAFGGVLNKDPKGKWRVFSPDHGDPSNFSRGLRTYRSLGHWNWYSREAIPSEDLKRTHKGIISGTPDSTAFKFDSNSAWVVAACDGFWDVTDPTRIPAILDDYLQENSGAALTAALVSEILIKHAIFSGSTDNITVNVMDVREKVS